MPGASGLILPNAPEFTIVASTVEFAAFAGAEMEDFIGGSLFKYFPDNPEAPVVSSDIRASLAKCMATKQKNELAAQRYDIADNAGIFREMYWTVIHTPILDEDQNIVFIIHTAVDNTDRILGAQKDERIKSLEPAHNLFMQSTVAIHIFKGFDMIIEMANKPTLELWQSDASVIGKPLLEVLPELASQKYPEIIRNVLATGQEYVAHEAPVLLHRNGKEEKGYFNFILQPYFEPGASKPSAVIAMVNEVTDIFNDRKALDEKQRSLDLAVEIGDLGVFNIDLRHNTVSYSPQIMEWFGVTQLHLPIAGLLQKVHPDDYDIVNDTLARLAKGHRSWKHDIVFRVPNPKTGKMQHLRSIGQVQVEGGIPVTLSGIIQDITNVIHSKEEIEQSEQRLRSLIESAPFPIGVYVGREMKIVMANQSIVDVWGKGSDIVGRTYREVLPELEGSGIFEKLDQVYTTGEAYHAHNQQVDLFVNGKLQPYFFNYSFTPLFDASGNVYGVMNTAADVTDLNLAKTKIEESERNFRSMILQAPVAICILRGNNHRFSTVNHMMEVLIGRPATEVEGRPLFEAMPELSNEGLQPILREVIEKGVSYISDEQEFRLLRNGEFDTAYIRYIYEPMTDTSGHVGGVMVVATDVTQQVLARRKIEDIVASRTRELAEANLRLQRSNAELEQFAYIASHDLQEPLRKISLFTQMLEISLGTVNDRARYQMERINNSVSRMTNLIRDILGYSQLSRKNDVFAIIDLGKVLAEAVADFDLILQEKGGSISHSNLPEIEAIPLQMVQLFNNLVSNSLKYSRPGVPPRISISGSKLTSAEIAAHGLSKSGGGYCKLSFRDNGIGFAQEYADKIFHIFQRLHGKMQYEGTGIGLAMCRKIAENHKGLIYAVGHEGEGAEFVVVLPVKHL